MKMVKSLLLGSAAGIVAVAGAQAADYPVKAAVQYVKICNLYGDGFYYLPGTNICVKIGGYARAEMIYSPTTLGNFTNGPFAVGSSSSGGGLVPGEVAVDGFLTERTGSHDYFIRSRAYISMDTREQTEWGTLRTYVNIGLNYDSPNGGASGRFDGNRAFIQFAGFTFGLAQSFFDFYSVPISHYNGWWASDTGDSGWKVFAYTANFGGGISSTLSIEEPRRQAVVSTNMIADPLLLGATPTPADNIKIRYPDLVHNWRIDQSWGSAQIMGALHDASAGYYTPLTNAAAAGTQLAGALPPNAGLCAEAFNPTGIPALAVANTAGNLTGSEACGHPSDKIGYAVGVGSKHNIIPAMDYFQWQLTYSKGATRYVAFFPSGPSLAKFAGANLAYGMWTDGVLSTALGSVHLTEAWAIDAAYDHFWTPAFKTSVYGHYMKMNYDADANAAICNMQNNTFGPGLQTNPALATTHTGALTNVTACNNDWGMWTLGSRTQYNFTPAFYVGLDVTYSQLMSASKGGTAFYTPIANTEKPASTYNITNVGDWAFRFRIHREILP